MSVVRHAVAVVVERPGLEARALGLAVVLAVLPALFVLDLLVFGISSLRERWALSHTSAVCPGCGSTVELVGDFTCSACGQVSLGTHGFAACEHCAGEYREYGVACACGALVRNPLWRSEAP